MCPKTAKVRILSSWGRFFWMLWQNTTQNTKYPTIFTVYYWFMHTELNLIFTASGTGEDWLRLYYEKPIKKLIINFKSVSFRRSPGFVNINLKLYKLRTIVTQASLDTYPFLHLPLLSLWDQIPTFSASKAHKDRFVSVQS